MKRYFNTLMISLLALAPVLLLSAGGYSGLAHAQGQAADAQAESQKEVTDEDVAAYDAYEAAKNEPDYQKRATKLLEWIGKYPKSDLMPHIEYEYLNLIGLCDKEEKWELLRSTSEQWLKLKPNHAKKRDLTALIAKASEKLGDYKKCAECLEEIYAMTPSGELALSILDTYKRVNNLAKTVNWSEKIFQMPEYDDHFWLRSYFVKIYSDSKNVPETVKYCRLSLKSADAAKQLNEEQQKQVVDLRTGCHQIIGDTLYQADKFAEASKEFQQAVKYKKTSIAYYYLGMCQWNMKDVDEAQISLASADLVGDDKIFKDKAKEQLEILYKSQHNNNTVGIDKVYRKAKEALGM